MIAARTAIDLVVAAKGASVHAVIRGGGLEFACILGRAGASSHKAEGDNATPVGRFALRRVLYRPDRCEVPATRLAAAPIARDDGWCDDPADALYNQPVKLPYRTRAEPLWRDDGLYDVLVVLGHNDDPVIAGAGSAIFMHVAAANGEPTAGCIALARDELLALLKVVEPGSVLEVKAL